VNRVQSKILIVLGILYAILSLIMIEFFGNFNFILLFIALIMVAIGAYWYSKAPNVPKPEKTKPLEKTEMCREDFFRKAKIPGYVQYKYLDEKGKGIVIFALFIIGLSLFTLYFYISFHNSNVSDFDDFIWIGPFVLSCAMVGVYFSIFWSMIDINAYCNRINMPSDDDFWSGGYIKNTKMAMIILVLCAAFALIGMTILTLK